MVIFNEAKPKYEKLDELFEPYILDIRFSNQVNIIVDLKEIAKKFLRPDVIASNPRSALIEEISSDMINVISHYRNYFYKKGKYTTFYFLYSFEKCEELKKKNPNYKETYYEKYFDNEESKVSIIKNSIKVVEKVISVVPNAFFIETSKYDEFIYAKYITSLIPENQLGLILSNDDVFCQLLKSNIIMLNLKGIRSEILTSKDCIGKITKKEFSFSSNLLPLVLAISGNKKYNITGLPMTATIKACTIVDKLLKKNLILDADSIEFPIKFESLNKNDKMENSLIINSKQLIENYNLIRLDDVLFSHKIEIASSLASISKRNGTANYFKELNSKIFTRYPIQLDMLLKGEKI